MQADFYALYKSKLVLFMCICHVQLILIHILLWEVTTKKKNQKKKLKMPAYTCPSLLICTFLLSFQGLSKWCANWKGRLSLRIHSTLNTPPSPAEPQSWLFSLPISEDILENPCIRKWKEKEAKMILRYLYISDRDNYNFKEF